MSYCSICTCVPQRLQHSFHVHFGLLQHPDRSGQGALAALDDLNDHKGEQAVPDVLTGHSGQQALQAAAVALGIDRQQIGMRIGVIDDPGDIDLFSGLRTRKEMNSDFMTYWDL